MLINLNTVYTNPSDYAQCVLPLDDNGEVVTYTGLSISKSQFNNAVEFFTANLVDDFTNEQFQEFLGFLFDVADIQSIYNTATSTGSQRAIVANIAEGFFGLQSNADKVVDVKTGYILATSDIIAKQ